MEVLESIDVKHKTGAECDDAHPPCKYAGGSVYGQNYY